MSKMTGRELIIQLLNIGVDLDKPIVIKKPDDDTTDQPEEIETIEADSDTYSVKEISESDDEIILVG